MRCLVFWKDGHIRRAPLDKPVLTIGRSPENDLVIDDRSVSKRHCLIEVTPEHITIRDQGSRNGIFVDERQLSTARIPLNGSFRIGGTEFLLQKGDARGFRISAELSDLITACSRRKKARKGSEDETGDDAGRYEQLIYFLAKKALLIRSPHRFFDVLRDNLRGMITSGSLFFLDASNAHVLVDNLCFSDTASLLRARRASLHTLPWNGRPLRCELVDSPTVPGQHTLAYLNDAGQPTPSGLSESIMRKLIEIIDFELELKADLRIDEETVPAVFSENGAAIVGRSPAIKRAADMARRIAPRDSFVLIMGESGTGKELFAKMIHSLSGRRGFVAINCAAIPANLLESEVFGYEAGAFTDAKRRKIGKIEESSGGTLVLDEIGDMPLEIQAKLLRVIQERAVVRLGANEPVPIDLRIMALTNQDLYALVEQGRFRRDLFYRLRVHEIRVPPLRERKEDIAPLVRHFCRQYAERNGVAPAGFSESVMDCFNAYGWPGNVRELENEIRRIMEIVDDGELVSDHHILDGIASSCRGSSTETRQKDLSLKEKVENSERDELRRALDAHHGNKTLTARAIGMSYRGLLKKLKRLGIDSGRR